MIPLVLFLSCNKTEKNQEVISFEELAGSTGSDSTAPSVVYTMPAGYTPEFASFVSRELPAYDTIGHKKIHPMDRFGFSHSYKLDFKEKIPSNQPAETQGFSASVYYYTFSDTLKTKNAFYNWLDCFGKSCAEIKPGQSSEELDALPSSAIVYDTTVIAIEYVCGQNGWKTFEDSVIANFGKKYRYRFNTTCTGSINWK